MFVSRRPAIRKRWGRRCGGGSRKSSAGRKLPEEATGSGRRELAEWLTDPKNPLTARVMVNRIWHYHFGRGPRCDDQ